MLIFPMGQKWHQLFLYCNLNIFLRNIPRKVGFNFFILIKQLVLGESMNHFINIAKFDPKMVLYDDEDGFIKYEMLFGTKCS